MAPYGIGGRSVDVFVQTERLSYCMPLGKQIGSYYPCATTARQYGQDDADRPLTDYQHRFPSRKSQRFNTFHARVYGLDKSSLLEGNAFGNANYPFANDPLHHPNILGKTASAGLVTSSRADFLVRSDIGRTPCAGSSSIRRKECDGTPSRGRRVRNR